MTMRKPCLLVMFEGVIYPTIPSIHDKLTHPPLPGAMAFLTEAVTRYDVLVYSPRNCEQYGIAEVWDYLRTFLSGADKAGFLADAVLRSISFPKRVPAGVPLLSPRAVPFDGRFPSLDELNVPLTAKSTTPAPTPRPTESRIGLWGRVGLCLLAGSVVAWLVILASIFARLLLLLAP